MDALDDAERFELLAYIEDSLGAVPTTEQQTIAEHRLAELRSDPFLGRTIEETIAAGQAYLEGRRRPS
ncbi:MAG: addiction module protein [Aeromicrobium sp.]|uniref:addiction module protein n=1 Tax=Aeromicrobium sp. TaxID=1871063 RepID=UPI0039E5E536